MAVTESYDAIVKKALSSLSLTEEQWETSTEPIIAENLERLSLMVTHARKRVGVANATLDIGFGYGYTTAALRAAFPGARNVGLEHPSRALTWLPSFRRLVSQLETNIVGGDAHNLPLPTSPSTPCSPAKFSNTCSRCVWSPSSSLRCSGCFGPEASLVCRPPISSR
jgi:SAM-dependent methyltransferase